MSVSHANQPLVHAVSITKLLVIGTVKNYPNHNACRVNRIGGTGQDRFVVILVSNAISGVETTAPVATKLTVRCTVM